MLINQTKSIMNNQTWLCFSGYFINNAYLKWTQHPVIITTAPKPVLFSSIPFPAITICNLNRAKKSVALKIPRAGERMRHTNTTSKLFPIDWSLEKGFPSNIHKYYDIFPRPPKGIGEKMGLTVILNSSSNDYYCSVEKGNGFKFLLHSPIEHPKIRNFGSLFSSGTESRVNIKPIIQVASQSLRNYNPNIRKCLFPNEGNLTYFRQYTRKNCQLECEANILYNKCGCILFYLPMIVSNAKICGPYEFNCTIQTLNNVESYKYSNITCETCEPDDDITVIHFFYSRNYFQSQQLDVIITFTDFLSNIGGLLGLFLGFSIFSVIEIIYFFIFKPIIDHIKYKNFKKNLKAHRIKANNLKRLQKVKKI
ncbi:pickpocket protein 28-like [Condylostylus longicornis]|uniref:pickpocket protein 28-like n=1 Tax=Condylostylus longicornis TaxID=2530218 RepID=UPI00244E49F4|nr:pickpocket protein 28-like [Condylostylus longicornis]